MGVTGRRIGEAIREWFRPAGVPIRYAPAPTRVQRPSDLADATPAAASTSTAIVIAASSPISACSHVR